MHKKRLFSMQYKKKIVVYFKHTSLFIVYGQMGRIIESLSNFGHINALGGARCLAIFPNAPVNTNSSSMIDEYSDVFKF